MDAGLETDIPVNYAQSIPCLQISRQSFAIEGDCRLLFSSDQAHAVLYPSLDADCTRPSWLPLRSVTAMAHARISKWQEASSTAIGSIAIQK